MRMMKAVVVLGLLAGTLGGLTSCAKRQVVKVDPDETPEQKAARLERERKERLERERKEAVQKAFKALEARQFADARDFARMGLEANPGNTELRYVLASSLVFLGDYDDGIKQIEALITEKPDEQRYQMTLADALRRRATKADLKRGLKILQKMAKKDEFSPTILASMVVFHRLRHEEKKAEQLIQKLLSRHPDSVDAYMNLSSIYFGRAQREKDEAAKRLYLAKAESVTGLVWDKLKMAKIEQGKAHAPLHNNLGMIWIERGEQGRALSSWKRALELNPDLLEPHLNIGAVALRYRDFGTAEKHYGRVLKSEPSHPEALEAIAHAKNAVAAALSDKPEQLEVKAKEAIAAFEKVLQINPKNGRARLEIAGIYERLLSKLEPAVVEYNKYIKMMGGAQRLGKDHKIVKKVSDLTEQIAMEKEFGEGG